MEDDPILVPVDIEPPIVIFPCPVGEDLPPYKPVEPIPPFDPLFGG